MPVQWRVVVAGVNWEVVGGDPAPGEPDAYFELARALGATASNAEDAHRRLRAIGDQVDESIWRGEAADAFREKIGELPDKLKQLFEACDVTAERGAARVDGDVGALFVRGADGARGRLRG